MAEEKKLVTVTVDGRDVQVAEGTLLLDAATEAGVHIPVYCAHPKMDPVAVCRMCLVQVEKMPKLQPACATTVSDGMVAHTKNDAVAKMREGVLELLLLNHPLDCPVCDRGGECDLQDFAFRYGPDTSRSPITEKRHARKAVPLSEKIELDNERCILCWRCVRYYDEITGEKELVLQQRGSDTVIATFNDQPLTSAYQGNLPEVCPVGALTHRQYRFVSRPWDLQRTPSVCPECSYGCNLNADTRDFDIKRFTSRDNPDVDDMWLCDRGRYSVDRWNGKGEKRVRRAVVRDDRASRDVTSADAIKEAAKRLQVIREKYGNTSIAFLASPLCTNEEAFLFQKLGREVIGTPHIDHRIDDYPAPRRDDFLLGIAEIEECAAVIVLGTPEEAAPVLRLRLFKASHKRNVAVHRITSPQAVASLTLPSEGSIGVVGDEKDQSQVHEIAAALRTKGRSAKTLVIPRGVNGRGAQEMGVSSTSGPGFQTVPVGKSGADILEAIRNHEIRAVVLLNAQSAFDEGDDIARQALNAADLVIAIETDDADVARAATVLIPGHSYFEKMGTVTNVEGRVQKIRPALPPATGAPNEVRLLHGLAAELGETWDYLDMKDLHREIAAAVPGWQIGARITEGQPA